MKIRFIIFLGIIAMAMASCDVNGSSNSTPDILFVTIPIVNKTDTLNGYSTDDASVKRLDTIQVGDTVTFRILFWGFSNNLSICDIIQSDTSAAKFLFPADISLDSVFISSASDYANGKFVFKNKVQSLYFPFKYVAKKASTDARISFFLSSDADFSSSSSLGNNSFSFILKTPIRLVKPLMNHKH